MLSCPPLSLVICSAVSWWLAPIAVLTSVRAISSARLVLQSENWALMLAAISRLGSPSATPAFTTAFSVVLVVSVMPFTASPTCASIQLSTLASSVSKVPPTVSAFDSAR